MRCCANCFGDEHLRLEVIPSLTDQTGNCSYCGSNNEFLVVPIRLRDYFELLTNIYEACDEGVTLVEWLKKDWAMFRHPTMDVAHAKELLAEILDDGDVVRKRFKPPAPDVSDALERWEALRGELMHSNRFFPQTEINLERLKRLFSFLLIKNSNIPKRWHRARIQQSGALCRLDEMGAPPKNLASHGRANPAGIPYLYLASTELTAISEVRPHTGEEISVAEFSIPEDLKIADLRHPRRTISPFILPDENEISLLRQDIEFLEKLGQELTRPVLPRSAAFDYIPSQYLCEYVKVCGFDGVMYRSSVGDGENLALFSPSCATGVDVRSIKVSRVSVEFP